MALETQLIDIPFAQGPSQKLDKVIPDKSRLAELVNGSFNETGTIKRRPGWALLPGITSNSTSQRPMEMVALGDELLYVNSYQDQLWSYSPALKTSVAKGTPSPFQLGVDQVAPADSWKVGLDHASIAGVSIYVWQDRNQPAGTIVGIKYVVVDDTSNSVVVPTTTLAASASAGKPRVCAVTINGDAAFIVVWSSSATALSMASVRASTGAILTTATSIATDAKQFGSVNYYDVATFPGTSYAAVAYGSSKASTDVGILLVDHLATVKAAEITAIASGVAGTLGSIALGAFVTTPAMGVIIGDASNALFSSVVTLSGATLSATSAASWGTVGYIPCIGAIGDPNTANLAVMTGSYTGAAETTDKWTLSSANSVSFIGSMATTVQQTSPTRFFRGQLASKPFVMNGNFYVCVSITSPLQSSIQVVDIVTGNVLASPLYGLCAPQPSSGDNVIAPEQKLPTVSVNAAGTSASIPILTAGSLSFSEGTQTTLAGISRARLSYGRAAAGAGTGPLWHAMAAGYVFFSGAIMTMYDTVQVAEAGFIYFPEGVNATASGSGSVSGTFEVCAVFEWVDGLGRRHQSAPSPSVSVSLVSNTTITMTSPGLQLGVRKTKGTVVFYRTANGGTTFYRVNPVTVPLVNGTTVSYADTTMTTIPTADPVTSNEILYTDSGALPNDMPCACTAIANYQGRIAYSNAEDLQEWRFSQAPKAGQGLYFNELLLGGRIPQACGGITALHELDDKLLIATATNKLVTAGQGPDSTGAGSTYYPPQLLPSDVGVLDQRTIALLPDVSAQDGAVGLQAQGGLGHQTRHGYYLLDRGLVDRYIGMPLDATLAGGASISSAVVLQDRHQLRLTMGPVVAAYDYLFGQWDTHQVSGVGAADFQAACVWRGLWTAGGGIGASQGLALMLGNTPFDGVAGVYQDATASGLDKSAYPVAMRLTTAWIKVASLQGFQRVRNAVFFGPYSEASTITVTPQYDYDASNTAAGVSVSTAACRTGDGARWQFRYQLPIQKCEAIRFVITETPTSGDFRGVGLSGMTLEVGVQRGPARLSSSKSV